MRGLWPDANSTVFAGTFNSCIVLARLPFQKALSVLQQFNLKQNTMHRSLARPRISPVRGGEQNFFSLQQSLCPWPGVAGCEQHEYVDCIKPSHHALPAIKHKNRKISRWEANYLQVKNGLSKYFEGELQAPLKRSVTRERSHTWYQCTALQCFQFSELIQNTFTCLEIGLF